MPSACQQCVALCVEAQCSEIAIAAHVTHTQGTQLSRKGHEELAGGGAVPHYRGKPPLEALERVPCALHLLSSQ